MTNLTQKSSKQFFGAAMRVVTLTLFLVVFGAGAARAQTRGYVTNLLANSVSVIDPATNTVVATVPVGNRPRQVAVTPNGAFAYVTNESDSTVSVISAATNTVVATVPVGAFPDAIAITPNGAFAYVGCSASVDVIATATDTVIATIPGVTFTGSIAITPNGASAYALSTLPPQGDVTVIDTATNTVTTSVHVSNAARGLAITPNGSFVYVTDQSFFRVFVLSTTTNTVVGSVGLGGGEGIDFTPNGAFAYVAVPSGAAVIDTATNTVVTTVPAGSSPIGVAINPAGTFAYVTNSGSNDVSVINTSTNAVVATIPVGSRPLSVAFGVRTHGPTNKDQCKDGGWQTFTNPSFKNQGQCIKFVNHMDEGNN